MKKITLILSILIGYLLSTVPCHAYRDLETGMFLTRDPAGFIDGPNVYTYVRQNPWTYYDPHGLFIDTIWDVGNVLYDGGAIAWNIGATIGGGAVSMIGAATGNKYIEEAGVREVTQAMRNLGNSAVDVGTDAFAAVVPLVPAGVSKVVRATDKTLDAVDAAKDGKKLVDKGKDVVDSARSIEKKSEAAVEPATDAAKTTKQGGRITEPDLPSKTVVSEDGVDIVHYTRSGDHGPPHLHVKGGGAETTIGQAGKPIDGSGELSATQRAVVKANKSEIRKAADQIGRWFRFNNSK